MLVEKYMIGQKTAIGSRSQGDLPLLTCSKLCRLKNCFLCRFFAKIIQVQCDPKKTPTKKTPPHPRSKIFNVFFFLPKLLRFHKANLFLKCQTAQFTRWTETQLMSENYNIAETFQYSAD